jgi:hypothetical protein
MRAFGFHPSNNQIWRPKLHEINSGPTAKWRRKLWIRDFLLCMFHVDWLTSQVWRVDIRRCDSRTMIWNNSVSPPESSQPSNNRIFFLMSRSVLFNSVNFEPGWCCNQNLRFGWKQGTTDTLPNHWVRIRQYSKWALPGQLAPIP